MALISESLNKTSKAKPDATIQTVSTPNPMESGPECTCLSSQDATQLDDEKDERGLEMTLDANLPRKKKECHSAVSLGAKSSSRRSDWPVLSSLDQLTHSIINTWFGVKSVRKISIRVKGNIEILRHHRSEKHLRRDQRWPYEHLKSVDPITQKTQHRVRRRNGKILTKIEVTKEILKIIPVEPVDFG